MAVGSGRTGRNLIILVCGFITGGVLSGLLQRFLPDSAAKSFFTVAFTPTVGPFSVDLLVISFTLGPVGLHVSLLSLIGVVIAYLIARSLF
jgi:hypothetical protein